MLGFEVDRRRDLIDSAKPWGRDSVLDISFVESEEALELETELPDRACWSVMVDHTLVWEVNR